MILWIYPLIILLSILSGIARSEEQVSTHSPLLSGILDSGFLLPWIASLEMAQSLLPLTALFLLAGFWLMARLRQRTRLGLEAMTKLSLSWFLGFILIIVSLSPTLHSLYPLSLLGFGDSGQEISESIIRLLPPAAWTVGLFLLWGLPPLQQGSVDAGDVGTREEHIRINLSFRVALIFGLSLGLNRLHAQSAAQLLDLSVAFALIGLGLSRLVAGVQISLQRCLSYLTQGLLLPLLFLMPQKGSWQLEALALVSFVLLSLFWAWHYARLECPEKPHYLGWDDPETLLLPRIQALPRSLRRLLHLESILVLIFSSLMIYHRSYISILPAAFFIVASQAVARDLQAFSGRGQLASE